MKTTKISIYEEITDKIITALEDGVNPWAKPWQTVHYGPFRNALTNRPYRGMNVLLLNLVALSQGHVDPRWLTFRNAEQLGGHVRKGEKGAAIVFWKFLPARDRDGDAEPDALTDDEKERKLIPFARAYTVFNVEQCEGLNLPELEPGVEIRQDQENNELADRILALPKLKHGGNSACYLPVPDLIILPHRVHFEHADFYYSAGYHETIHWTGHPNRLNRVFSTRFGGLGYAFEELVAEIGAAFLGAHTDIPFDNMHHPEYINQWLQILKGNSKAIFSAAAKAQHATDFVLDKAGIASVQEHPSTAGELAVAA
jgi:antirestriction protein ArdC